MGRAHEVRAASMAKTAAAKTKVYSKFGKEILVAAKSGVPDPEMNLELRRVIERAKKAQVPGDLIKRAIDRAKSGSAAAMEALTYEGFGPGASTVIVDCLTDNLNRTISDVRAAFTKSKGKLGVGGSVTHTYNHVAYFEASNTNEDAVIEALLMAEIDVKSVESEDGIVYIQGEVSDRNKIADALESIEGISVDTDEITYLPENDEYVTLSDEDKVYFERLLAMLNECEDVQQVYHNVEL